MEYFSIKEFILLKTVYTSLIQFSPFTYTRDWNKNNNREKSFPHKIIHDSIAKSNYALSNSRFYLLQTLVTFE